MRRTTKRSDCETGGADGEDGLVAPKAGPDTTAGRRRLAARAGHEGDVGTARSMLTDDSPAVRATALGALSRMGGVTDTDLAASLADADPTVRRRACEVGAAHPGAALVALLDDDNSTVVEAAAWAIGEWGETAGGEAVTALSHVAADHEDPLCREAAVAALGAVGDVVGLPAILGATTDRPAIRRRAVLALAPFEGPEVATALERALTDKDWQVRQAAEDLLRE